MKKFLSLLLALIILLLTPSALAGTDKNAAYVAAMNTYSAGMLEQAMEQFRRLDGYMESEKFEKMCGARLMLSTKDYEGACSVLETLGDFEFAHIWLLYAQAEALLAHDLYSALELYAQAYELAFAASSKLAGLSALRDLLTLRLSFAYQLSSIVPTLEIGPQTYEGIEIRVDAPIQPHQYLISVEDSEGLLIYSMTTSSNVAYYEPDPGLTGEICLRVSAIYKSFESFDKKTRLALLEYNEFGNDGLYFTPSCAGVTTAVLPVPAAPQITWISQDGDGIHIAWNPSEGADRYVLYRQDKNGEACIFESDGACAYTDKEALWETEYAYSVVAYTGEMQSAPGEKALFTARIAAPVLNMPVYSHGQVRLSWSAVPGADEYRVYRAGADGEFQLLFTGTQLSCTDSAAEKGVISMYAVSACTHTGAEKRSNIIPLSIPDDIRAPELLRASLEQQSVQLEWSSVPQAEGYQVYRSENGAAFAPLANTADCRYTDTDLAYGREYAYCVAALAGWCDEAVSNTRSVAVLETLEAPYITSCEYKNGCAHIAWTYSENAQEYRLFRRNANSGSTTMIYSGAAASFSDSSPAPGASYEYYVQAVSRWNNTAESAVRLLTVFLPLSAPVLTADDSAYNRIELRWNAVENAEYYTVYRSASASAAGTVLAYTDGLWYTDENPDPSLCYYRVEAFSSYAESAASSASVRAYVKTAPPISEYTGLYEANASSYREKNNPDVSPQRAVDGSLETSWDTMNQQQGAWLYVGVTNGRLYEFSGFTIYNGKSAKEHEGSTNTYWHKNSRVREILVYVDGSFAGSYTLLDTRNPQHITLYEPVIGSGITFRIADVYAGTSYKDTCITEIVLW